MQNFSPFLYSKLHAVFIVICILVSVDFGYFQIDSIKFLSRLPFVTPSSVSEIDDVKLGTFSDSDVMLRNMHAPVGTM